MAQRSGYNDTNGMGTVIGALTLGALGFSRWGWKGLAAALVGAIIGTVAETAFVAGRQGRASLLLSLAPLSVFAVLIYLVWKYFR